MGLQNWDIKTLFGYLTGITIILMAAILFTVHLTGKATESAQNAEQRRYVASQLSLALNLSSDNLTKNIRAFVETGNQEFLQAYNFQAKVRVGDVVRPEAYNGIDWTTIYQQAGLSQKDGAQKSLIELMQRNGFSEKELQALSESQNLSADLTKKEAQAIQLINSQGRGQNNIHSVAYTQAKDLVFGSDYEQEKANVEKPIQTFNALMSQRVEADLSQSVKQAKTYNFVLTVLVIAVVVLLAAALYGTYRILIKQLGAELKPAAQIVEAIANGDLTSVIQLRHNDRSSLLANMQRMQSQLIDIISQVRSSTDSVTTAAVQISAGSTDLATRTEQQSSSLTETAASVEEITTTVANNSNNARQASEMAGDANASSQQGQQSVHKLLETMSSISVQSQKIADIVGIIDGIAFQTNLLALNASVEAARAGEHGRGFAVVASEVRTLSERSANAAKEIKQLIDNSIDVVKKGDVQAKRTVEDIEKIEKEVSRVDELLAEINRASEEQATAITQVNTAVAQMDEVTTQNAGLVEETAAAASNLKVQAQQLTQQVSVFKLSTGVQNLVQDGHDDVVEDGLDLNATEDNDSVVVTDAA